MRLTLVLTAGLLALITSVDGRKQDKAMKTDLTDLPSRPAGRSLSNLSAQLGVEAAQRTDGLVVSVAIANRGQQEVVPLNPFPLIQFQVLDAKGRPLTVPTKPPELLVHRSTGESWRANNPLRIIHVYKNQQAVAASHVDGKVLTLAAGDEYEVTFEIDKVREKKNGSDVTVPIADGTYKVSCIVTLIDAADANQSRILQSPPLEVLFEKRK